MFKKFDNNQKFTYNRRPVEIILTYKANSKLTLNDEKGDEKRDALLLEECFKNFLKK